MKIKNTLASLILLTGILGSCSHETKTNMYRGYNQDSTVHYSLVQTIERHSDLAIKTDVRYKLIIADKPEAEYDEGFIRAKKDHYSWEILVVNSFPGSKFSKYADLDSLDKLISYGIKQYEIKRREND